MSEEMEPSQIQPMISHEDAAAVMRLLSDTAVVPGGIRGQKEFLAKGIAKLIGAEVWIWGCSRTTPPGKTVAFSIIHGGYTFPEQQSLWIISITHMSHHLSRLYLSGKVPGTWTRRQIIPDDQWYPSDHYKQIHSPTRLDDIIISLFPIGPEGLTSDIGFHRSVNNGQFSDRDRYLVHLILSEVDWLHTDDTIPEAVQYAHSLTLREHQVLLFLLAGDSRKQIAAKMDISEHTVGDHLKRIHKHFNVSSAGELMAKFLTQVGGKHV